MRFAPQLVLAERREGETLLRSPIPLPAGPPRTTDWLAAWAARAPERMFLLERRTPDAAWTGVTWGEAWTRVRGLAAGLLGLGLGPTRPLALLSDNGVDHALLQLAGQLVGVPVAPLSPAYSLLSADHARLREVLAALGPGAVFAADARYAGALAVCGALPCLTSADLDGLAATPWSAASEAASAAVGPDTVAKVLFTSGSTGSPRGVVNTHRMLVSNQEMIAALWPLVQAAPPVVVDWLPWSHTFGGNHNFNLILRNGGTLYVDDGKATPQLIERTVRNLREIAPTLYFNVPRGLELLVAHLEQDAALRERFFSRLEVLFFAAAALPPGTRARLLNARGASEFLFASAWGSTETAPLSTSAYFPTDTPANIGLPAPGVTIKLARPPGADLQELRVLGPNVSPGTWSPGGGITPLPRDADGYLPTGDAARLEDEAEPSRGILFQGRIGENFKLTSGTWVAVGRLRVQVVDACAGDVLDAAIAGQDRDDVRALLFAVRPADPEAEAALRARVQARLRAHAAAHPASSERLAAALLVYALPSLDAGETTDKGYLNQRRTLACRAALVERLYADDPEVIGL